MTTANSRLLVFIQTRSIFLVFHRFFALLERRFTLTLALRSIGLLIQEWCTAEGLAKAALRVGAREQSVTKLDRAVASVEGLTESAQDTGTSRMRYFATKPARS